MPKRSKNRMGGLSIRYKKGRYIRAADRDMDNNINTSTINERNDSNTNNTDVISNDIVVENVINTSDLVLSNDEDQQQTGTHNDDCVPVVSDDETKQVKYDKKEFTRSTRWTVYHLFRHKYNGMYPKDGMDLYQHWSGKDGIALKIKKDMNLPKSYRTSQLIPCFEKIMECLLNEVEFDPSMVENRRGHRKATIRLDSPEAQILANGLESGLSVKRTWVNINKHRHDNGQELISQSCVLYALKSMKPRLVKIKKRKQGSNDPNSSWSQARHAWTSQLLARFGKLEHVHGPIERRFNRDLVGKLELNQIVWWDETHRKCLIGGHSETRDFHLQFPRNKSGKFDAIHGEYSTEELSVLNVKYEKECRIGLGVAMVTPLAQDNTTLPNEGRRCFPFNYTSKVLISIDDYKRLKKVEFNRVKSLTNRIGVWVESSRIQGKLYQNDPVSKLKGVGKKMSEKLASMGLKTVNDIKQLTNIKDIERTDGISEKKLTGLYQQALTAMDEDCPPDIDHRKKDNPYKSKYGTEWKKYLKKSVTFSHSVSIADYIVHMMEESKRVMEGTIHEDTWMVYHDALSLMTSKGTKDWMKKKGYYERWVLPSEDLYDTLDPEIKRKYKQNPIGNSPEFMPLDAHLNQDVHASHDFHKCITAHLDEDHPNKFSGSTPLRLVSSYQRIFHPTSGVAPSSNRIMEDITRVLNSLEKVRGARGCIVNDCSVTRQGRRFESNKSSETESRGGPRYKDTQENYLQYLKRRYDEVHRDALPHWEEKTKEAAALVNEENIRNDETMNDNNNEIGENRDSNFPQIAEI